MKAEMPSLTAVIQFQMGAEHSRSYHDFKISWHFDGHMMDMNIGKSLTCQK